MRRFFFATSVLILLARPAVSDELRPLPYKALSPVMSAWRWTGCYAGGQADGLSGSSSQWIVRTPGGAFFGQSLGEHQVEGWGGGAQAGCDYQFAGRFVIGVQGDYAFMGGGGSHDSAREFGVAYHSSVESLVSVTGRIGYAWDRFLGYVRGGSAWERGKYAATTIVLGTAYTAEVTRPGWTIGVGGEYAFTDFLSGFIEYGYYDFGSRQIGLTPQVIGLGPAFVEIKETRSAVRAGLNFRFGGDAAPVAPRY
jgi:outer membrane immunogenic protein